jgi:RNA polymerase sigma-70 factor (ECF subfamily)
MPRWDDQSDDELLVATRREPNAFGAFYRRHEDAVLRFFLGRARDPELAVDLTAETFAAALVSVRRFRPGPAPARAWLFGIARNVLAMSLRRRRVDDQARRRLHLPPLLIDDELLERVEELRGVEAESELRERVEELPDDQRYALRARVVDEREYADIARELRCSEAVIRKRVSRALGSLRHQLGDTP